MTCLKHPASKWDSLLFKKRRKLNVLFEAEDSHRKAGAEHTGVGDPAQQWPCAGVVGLEEARVQTHRQVEDMAEGG